MFDSRWPKIPFIVLRALEVTFALIVLALSAERAANLDNAIGGSASTEITDAIWFLYFGLTTAVLALVVVGAILVLVFLTSIVSPVIALCVDVFFVVFYLISMAGWAAGAGVYLGQSSCTYTIPVYDAFTESSYDVTYSSPSCKHVKAIFAFIVMSLMLFIATLVLSAIVLHRNRTGGATAAAAEAGAVHHEKNTDTYNNNNNSNNAGLEPAPVPAPAPTGTPAPGYHQQQPEHAFAAQQGQQPMQSGNYGMQQPQQGYNQGGYAPPQGFEHERAEHIPV